MKRDVDAFDADAAAGGYLYAQGDRLSARLSNERMTAAILAIADLRGKRVIDLGCGDGTYTLQLARRGVARQVLGLDPAAAAIALAERRAAAEGIDCCGFMVGSVYDTPLVDGSYDVAVLRGVLHHLEYPAAAIKVALSVAREVVIVEPNGLNPVLKLIERLSPYHRAHGERSFLPMTLRRWVRAAGGQVAAACFINLVPMFSPDWLARYCKRAEPIVEAHPGIRAIACGQYVFRARKSQ